MPIWQERELCFADWNAPYMSVRCLWFIVLFKHAVFSLIFRVGNISFIEIMVVKSPTIIVLLSIFSFIFINICLIYLGAPKLNARIFTIIIFFLLNWSLYNYTMILFVSCHSSSIKDYFVLYEYSYLYSLLVTICIEYLFHL